MATFVSIVFTVLGFVLGWWVLRLVAGLLGAGNNGWGACFLAMVVPGLVGAVVGGVMAAVGLPPLLAVVVMLGIQVWMVAKFLETSILGAIAISVLATIALIVIYLGGFFLIAAVFGVGLLGLFGAAMIADPQMQMGGQMQMDPNSTVVIEESSSSRTTTTTTGNLSSNSSTTTRSSSGSTSGSPSGASTDSSSESTASVAPSRPAKKQVRYGYREVPIDNLGVHVNSPVKIELKDGRKRNGKLTKVGEGSLGVQQKAGSGSMDFTVQIDQIKRIEVYKRTQ